MIRTLADVGMSPTGLWQLWMCDCGKYRTYFVNTGHPIIQIRHEGKRLRPYDGPGVSGVQRQTDPRRHRGLRVPQEYYTSGRLVTMQQYNSGTAVV